MTRKQNLTAQLLDNTLTTEDLINTIVGLEDSLKIYKEENDNYEQSTHIDNFMYEMKVNEKGEVPCLIKIHGVEHTIGITERDAKSFMRMFQLSKMR